jgi:hypothetical protein
MLNEGLIKNDTSALVRSEIVSQLRRLGPIAPDSLERAVFKSLVGHDRDEVDWDSEGNQAGYYVWLKSFDQLIAELIEDGYILTEEPNILVPTQPQPVSEYSHVAHSPPPLT